jgi:two-component system response regulator GlrR
MSKKGSNMPEKPTILLLDFDHESELGETLRRTLSSSSLSIELQREFVGPGNSPPGDLSSIISRINPAVIFFVLSPRLVKEVSATFQRLNGELSTKPVIIVIEADQPDQMFEWLKLGAADFIIPPLRAIDIIPRIWRLLEQAHQENAWTQTLKGKLGLKYLIGESPEFQTEVRKIPQIAKCDANVLISGETGTGKELCARAIHYLSLRTAKPFIPVNCGAIPVELVENELFGHERGAFTGANRLHHGLIHETQGGTLFLDEIDCLPTTVQIKLLRFLQDKEYRPLGSTKMRQADVRIIAATNINLEEAVSKGKLRQDLYYRLNIIPFRLPPLRERSGDILLLASHFLAKYAAEFSRHVTEFSSEAMQLLMSYHWPGNVRELEHVVERTVVLTKQAIIQKDEIILQQPQLIAAPGSFQEEKSKVIAQFEKIYIQRLLSAYRGNISRAAQAARKNRRAFWQLIRKHRIDAQDFKEYR